MAEAHIHLLIAIQSMTQPVKVIARGCPKHQVVEVSVWIYAARHDVHALCIYNLGICGDLRRGAY